MLIDILCNCGGIVHTYDEGIYRCPQCNQEYKLKYSINYEYYNHIRISNVTGYTLSASTWRKY